MVLKGQCHEIINAFCYYKKSTWALYQHEKMVLRNLSFSGKSPDTVPWNLEGGDDLWQGFPLQALQDQGARGQQAAHSFNVPGHTTI